MNYSILQYAPKEGLNMNKNELSEIRRRLNPDKNAITCIRGCYVNEKREIVSSFCRPLLSFRQEEAERYLAIFRRTLTGVTGKNLIPIDFTTGEVLDGEEHKLLSALRNTQLKLEEGAEKFYRRVIDSLQMEGHYLILMLHDAYDVPYHPKDGTEMEDSSEEVFNYILAAVCPVKLTKPALSYFAADNDFHECEQNWIVAAPELGFMFPAYEDGAANLYRAMYFTRDTAEMHDEFISAVFHAEAPMPAETQKETFQSLMEETLGDELNYDVVQAVHEQLREKIEAQKADKTAEAPVVTKREMQSMLASCGVDEARVAAFQQRYDEEFGETIDLSPQNIVDEKKFELRTPNVVIQVSPGYSDQVETRVIDGMKYILVRADEGVVVNGMNIRV